MLDAIKEGDFVLVKYKHSNYICKWIYVEHTHYNKESLDSLVGIILKHNLKEVFYTELQTYTFNSEMSIFKKIKNKK